MEQTKNYTGKREVVLDTETTGLDPKSGHKIIEIGCVELINHIPTGNTWQSYINPKRDVPMEAYKIHGISSDFLKNKLIFKDVAQDFLNFIAGDPLIIHNASFDIGFLNYELHLISMPVIKPIDTLKQIIIPKSAKYIETKVIDTLKIARSMFPGSPNNLDALCKRLKVDNTMRDKHGALMDSELLAKVYLELLGGRQKVINFEYNQNKEINDIEISKITKYSKLTPFASAEEEKEHEKTMAKINK